MCLCEQAVNMGLKKIFIADYNFIFIVYKINPSLRIIFEIVSDVVEIKLLS